MRKVLLLFTLIVVIGIGIGTWYLLTNLDAIVKAAIEKYGSEATQTAVRVNSVKLDLTGDMIGSGAINGLTVGNPKGFESKQAISLGEVSTSIDLKSLTGQPYIIEDITVRAPKVFVEINADKKTNLNEIKKNLTQGASAQKAEPAKPMEKQPPRLILRRVLFTDGTIDARVVPLNKDYQLKLPTLNLRNLGGQNGGTPQELAREILDRIIDAARAEIKKKGIDAEIEKLKAKAEQKIEEEKAKVKQKVEDEKAAAQEKVDTKKAEEKQKLEDKLKGLIPQ
jgi:hypothetical protein